MDLNETHKEEIAFLVKHSDKNLPEVLRMFAEEYYNKKLMLDGVVKSFVCNNCHSERYRLLTPITYQCKECDNLQAK